LFERILCGILKSDSTFALDTLDTALLFRYIWSCMVVPDICKVSLLSNMLHIYFLLNLLLNFFGLPLCTVFLHEFLFNDFRWLLLTGWSSSYWTSERHQLRLWFTLWLVSGIYRYIGVGNLLSLCSWSVYVSS